MLEARMKCQERSSAEALSENVVTWGGKDAAWL